MRRLFSPGPAGKKYGVCEEAGVGGGGEMPALFLIHLQA